MFYITKIYLSSTQRVVSSCSFSLDTYLEYLTDTNGFRYYVFTVYDDIDCTFEDIDIHYLVHCIKLRISIKGVELRRSSHSSGLGVIVTPVKLTFLNMIEMKCCKRVATHTRKFNPDFLDQFGVSHNVRFAVVGSRNTNTNKLLYLNDSGSIETYSVRSFAKQLQDYSGNIVPLEDIFVIDTIGINNNISFYSCHSKRVVDVLHENISSIVDLYKLANIASGVAIGCSIPSNTEFVVDTLTDKYIFSVREGFRNFLLRQKLLSS